MDNNKYLKHFIDVDTPKSQVCVDNHNKVKLLYRQFKRGVIERDEYRRRCTRIYRGVNDTKSERLEIKLKNKKLKLHIIELEFKKATEIASLGIDGKCTRCGVLITDENRHKRKSYCENCYKL